MNEEDVKLHLGHGTTEELIVSALSRAVFWLQLPVPKVTPAHAEIFHK